MPEKSKKKSQSRTESRRHIRVKFSEETNRNYRVKYDGTNRLKKKKIKKEIMRERIRKKFKSRAEGNLREIERNFRDSLKEILISE